MYIEDEKRDYFDEELYVKNKRRKFRKEVVRAYAAMLFYGIISTIVFHIARFLLSAGLDYTRYREEKAEYIAMGLSILSYLLLFGFRHVENCGYVDAYDDNFSLWLCLKRFASASAMMLIIPYLIALRVNFLFVYIYNMCYTHSDRVSEVISEAFLHQYDGTTTLGIFLGTTGSFLVYLLLYIPFYYLGRGNYRRDLLKGAEIKVK